MADSMPPSVAVSAPAGRRGAALRWLLAALSAVSLGGCSGLLFYPQSRLVQTPADLGLDYRDVWLESADGVRLHGWWLPARAEPVRGSVYFLHGNAENISTHVYNVRWLPDQGYQVLLLDYRGFGRSEGTPLLPAVFEDIRAGFAYLLDNPASRDKPLFLLGQSLGASLGLYFAATDGQARRHLDAVVSDAAFASYAGIARAVAAGSWLTWLFQWPLACSMPDRFDPVDHVGAIAPTPLLLFHSRDDPIIPFDNALRLYRAARPPVFLRTTRGPHTATFGDPAQRRFLLTFFENVERAE